MTLKTSTVAVLLLFVLSEAAVGSGQEVFNAIPVFQVGEQSGSPIDWENIAPRLRPHIKVSILFSRWKIPAKRLPNSGAGVGSFFSLGWIRETSVPVPAAKQDLYQRNGVYRI